MNILSAENVGRDLGERWLFKGLTFGILQGEKVALIGANGCGKSTLLKILAGSTETDGGEVSIRKDIRVGYLEQEPKIEENLSVLDTIFYAENEITQALKKYEKALENQHQDLLGEAIETIEALNAWDYEAKVKQILGKLGIHNFEQKAGELSGGQLKRVALAKVLIDQPDFLILDEPTNHLDLDTIEWLEGYLSAANVTLLLVTHDRYFLDKVSNRILEIFDNEIHKYQGNYAYFLEKKAEKLAVDSATQEKNQGRLKKELEWMRRQPKARTTKAQYRIDAFHDLKEKTKGFRKEEKVDLNVRTERLGKKILEIDYISKKFGENILFENFHYTFKRGDKIGLVGKNGVGKSTLLEILQGIQKPDSGKVSKGDTVKIGYYSQGGLKFDENQKVIEAVREIAEFIKLGDGKELSISAFLNLFLFPPKVQHNYISKLSGGEKRRLQLLKILAESPNFLILDEPTNDLDIDTLNVLEEFLENYPGCIIVVSHDRYFMDRIVDHVFAFEGNGNIKDFPGNYTQYRLWKNEQLKNAELNTKPSIQITEKEEVQSLPKKKLSFKEKQELENLEGELENLENEKNALILAISQENMTYEQINELSNKLENLKITMENKEMRWLELSELGN